MFVEKLRYLSFLLITLFTVSHASFLKAESIINWKNNVATTYYPDKAFFSAFIVNSGGGKKIYFDAGMLDDDFNPDYGCKHGSSIGNSSKSYLKMNGKIIDVDISCMEGENAGFYFTIISPETRNDLDFIRNTFLKNKYVYVTFKQRKYKISAIGFNSAWSSLGEDKVGKIVVNPNGQYVGSLWVPPGKCFNREDIENFARGNYDKEINRLDSIVNEARNQNVDLYKILKAVQAEKRNAQDQYHKTLKDFMPVFCPD